MNSLYLVESPLQLMNAIEARFHFDQLEKGNEHHLILLQGVSDSNLVQMQSLLDDKWSSVLVLKDTNRRWRYRKPISLLNSKVKDLASINRVFIGEYRSILMRHVANCCRPKEVFLLDDGNYSIYIQKKLLSLKGERLNYNIIRILYDRLLNIQDDDLYNLSFFTVYENNIFEGNKNRFIVNKYHQLKSHLKAKNSTNEVYFLGSITPELNIISYDYYFKTLEGVFSYYKQEGRDVVYIPHRRESHIKLDRIKKTFGIAVRPFNLPIELAIVNEELFPAKISCFFSSALDNCYFLFRGKIKIDSFRIDESEVLIEEHKERINLNYLTYSSYRSDVFKIIELKRYLTDK